jgi:uncharacterized protein YdaU (DUF1376 family)
VAGVVPFYVDRWLAGTRGLSLEERGAFADWIASYGARDGVFPDDIKLFAEVWGCDPRVARRLRAQLLAKGKLYIDGELVHNFLAKSVVAKVIGKSAVRADAAFKRWKNHRENNGGHNANASANASDETMQMHMPSSKTPRENYSSLGESQQTPHVDNPPEGSRAPLADGSLARPPETLADLNQRMGWSPAGTRKPFT